MLKPSQIIKTVLCLLIVAQCSCAAINTNNSTKYSSDSNDTVNLKFTVEEAPEWTTLFNRTSGWFGADGIFAIPLNGKDNAPAKPSTKTMLIFSDSLIGEIKNNQLPNGFTMVNNTVAYMTGLLPDTNKISFYWAKNDTSKPISVFKPSTTDSREGDYYWLGDGFVNTELNNTTYIFAHRMRTLEPGNDWSFKEMATNLISIPANSDFPFKNHRQIQIPLSFNDGSIGVGIFVNTKKSGAPNPDGYIYLYGVKGKDRNLIVGRFLPQNIENFATWRFWDGKQWNADVNKASFIAKGVSNELSVSALPDGRYALVYQHNSMSPTVALRLGLTPYNNFGPMIEVWNCKEMEKKNIITYNAKAHPNLSRPGELLISYNVNAFDFHNEIKKDPNLYRPRFLRLKLQN